ncbi:MAG: HlyC/CorC family transporter, partial [Clostridiales bacterium]|nr:HlyC/CorC family transporter [Clostridiales bacterium]
TVGGWCIEMLGHYPEKDEEFTYKNLKITILEADERRVEKVLVEDISPVEEENEE